MDEGVIRTRTIALRRRLVGAVSLCTAAFLLGSRSTLAMSQAVSNATQGDRAEAHAEEGLQFTQAGNLPSAESELRKAVGLAPSNAEFLRDLATVLAMEKKFDESTAYFQRSLKIAPNDVVARRYLAANLWQMRRFTEARHNLR